MNTATKEKDNLAKELGQTCYDDIKDIYERLDKETDMDKQDEIQEEINEYSYGVNVEKTYSITLAGGGPACRIHGYLDESNEPYTAEIQYQDLSTKWETLHVDEDILLQFAQSHYFAD